MKNSTRWIIGGGAGLALLVGGGGVALAVDAGEGDDRPDVALTGNALEQASEAALAHVGGGAVTDSEVGDEEGHYEVEVTLGDGGEVDVHLDEDFTVLGDERDGDESDGDEPDEQVTGRDRDEAAAAALEAAGGGTVTEVEIADDGDTGYEAEVQLDDGTVVEVALDRDLTVTAVQNDDD
ncbi:MULTISPECIES: PepSY domain-containing protein [unclassified Modestobacter]|uniref:PepSY domain-containing protein n=1 Tax=unclassified Modestobacter TaxID=2643866 RepID=UPI0022AA177E|nr:MULTISPECIES: PepSY domain-containing protein [unclassified Modestobacter]MCZ2827196.1 hypothetical protein [Modestobacter sp. VKM Ac-2981]MCZ2854896.1 hypothetical protein [Modestobacter sp. VKM Ac-2982]